MFRHVSMRPVAAVLVLSCLCLACFGGKPPELEVTDTSIGPIDAQTPFDVEQLTEILKGYRVNQANGTMNGQQVPTLRVTLENEELLEIFSTADGSGIARIEVKSPGIHDSNGNSVGSTYTAIFGETPPQDLIPGMSEFTGHVLCPAPGLSNVMYVFHGDWTGPAGIIPPANVLETWSIRYIIWNV